MEINKNNKFIVNELRYNLGNYIIPEDVKNGIAVDVGCNNGCFIDKHKNYFKFIYGYEANFFLVEKLKLKFKEDNIFIHHNAVSNTDNKMLKLLANKFTDDNGSSAIEKNVESQDWEEFVCEAQSISLENILKRCDNNIDYMKIDCETSEYEFLIEKDLKNIKYISIELHCQLGMEKYTQLYNWISKTHNANENVNFRVGSHQEILFTKK